MRRTRVKFCGITRPEDAAHAGRLGVDAVGVVLRADSPRRVDEARAVEIFQAAGPMVWRVGLFVDTPAEEVAEVAARVGLHYAQRHGRDVSAVPGVPTIAAAPTVVEGDVLPLIDASEGRGAEPDWSLVAAMVRAAARPVTVAGGLTPDNVAAVIRQVRPFAVDVSSGIEGDIKGIKDRDMMRRFIQVSLAEQEGN